jgi:hypothetical protein
MALEREYNHFRRAKNTEINFADDDPCSREQESAELGVETVAVLNIG